MLSPDSLLSLRELLRLRRELPAQEVTLLLQTLPELLDDAGESGSPAALINEVVVCFEEAPPGGVAETARRTVRQWPAFRLLLGAGDEQDAGSTIVGGISLFTAPAPARLASLLYEMLGGRIRNEELLKGKYSPLAPVDEMANVLLRRALSKKSFPDCRTFWREWTQTIHFEAAPPAAGAAPQGWLIPERLLGAGKPGELLELTPLERPAVPTRLVARPVFRIGRSRRLSDVPARSATDVGSGEAIKELSRIHVQAEYGPGGIGFRDGNGERPSANGSTWNEQRLSAEVLAPISTGGMLLLSPTSCRYRLEVIPHPVHRLARMPVANLAAWEGSASSANAALPPLGALTFRHPRGAMVVRQSAWLLSALGAEVSSSGEFSWSDDDNPSQVFLHRHGCFWVANQASGDGIRLDEQPLGPKEVAPLSAGQVLEIEGVKFQVTLE